MLRFTTKLLPSGSAGVGAVVLTLILILLGRKSTFWRISLIIASLLLIGFCGRHKALFELGGLKPSGVLFAVLFGHLMFLCALLLSGETLRTCFAFQLRLPSCLKYMVSDIYRFLFMGIATIYEELLWRSTIQYYLGNSLLAVPFASALFLFDHIMPQDGSRRALSPQADRRRALSGRRASIRQFVELFFFACILGVVFILTGNIWYSIIIHFIRNFNLRCYTLSMRENRTPI